MTDLIGTRLNQYELREIIRRGGMSTVFKAYQDSLDRFVAVKVLFTGRDPQFSARFKREARAIAALQHHNILPVYDYGEQEGLLFLVLQYVEGGATLADMLGQPMAPTTALRQTSHVLDALDYAHKRGVIHRDIKPANVLMPTPNWPMLADFGIAKLMNDNQQRLTLANQIIGTAAYMAPEQATGRPIDARTDLYAAGVVLYELVTGRVPFDADTPMAVLTKHVYEAPPPARTLNPDLPASVEMVLQKALAKEPSARYQTADEMAEDLRQVAQQIDRDPKRSQMTGLYQIGLQAFEQGQWDEAVARLGQLVSINPEFEDASELLDAAREAQERAREEARQRIDLVRQQRMSGVQSQLRPPTTSDTPPSPAIPPPSPRTSVLQTTKLPELDLSAGPPPELAASATKPLGAQPTPRSSGTQTLAQPDPLPAGGVLPEATPEAAPPASGGGRLPIAWIIAGAVVVVLLAALVFILMRGRGGPETGGVATAAPAPTNAANPTAATGGGAAGGEAPTADTTGQGQAGTSGEPAPEPAGKIVFQEDFNNKAAGSGLEDSLSATDFSRGFHPPGVYHIIPSKPNTSNWVLLPRLAYRNFSMEITLWDNSDQLTGNLSEGVVFRARDQQHFYTLLIDPRNGKYTVRKYSGQNDVADVVPWKDSPDIKRQTEKNQIRVDAKDDTFTLYVNGKQADTFSDTSYPFGMLGLIADNVDAVKPHPHYDDLTVYSDDPPTQAATLPAERADAAGDMVLIPGGEFILGGNERGDAATHIFSLPNFYIDKTEVTNAAYKQCVDAGKCSPPRETDSPTHPDYFTNPEYAQNPVMYVTWEQARQFCTAFNKRLPSEAEWEKAASWNGSERTKVLYPFGNEFKSDLLNSRESNSEDTTAVAKFPAELNGTFDMAGNLSEWTNSLFKPYPYDETDGREEYPAPGERVFRGGSWAQTEGKARVFDRRSAPANYADREIGFRCATTP